MELSKKRKTGDSSSQFTTAVPKDVVAPRVSLSSLGITPQDARSILESLSRDQLVGVLQTVVVRDVAVFDILRSIAECDTTLRKLFIRSLGCETTTDMLRSVFSSFGELVDAVVVTDKATGKPKGYGFVTFKHLDGAILALKEPNKKIDGIITVTQLAAARDSISIDVSKRKVYVGNVPFEISPERLLNLFSSHGEIEEGPLGFDKRSGKPKGFAFFIYKTEEGANSSLLDPVKNIDGRHVMCKLATDEKKGKVRGRQGSMPGALTSFSGFSGGPSLAIGGVPGFGNHGPPSFGGGSGSGNRYAAVGYGSDGFGTDNHYGGRYASGEYPGSNNSGSSMNRLPPQVSGYPDVGNYSLPLVSQSRLPPAGARGHLGWRYQGGPPFY